MHLKITIVVDNRVGQGLSGEHGFSLWIETGTERVPFDTGQGSALAENARIRIEDDLAFWIGTETGLAVCVGCSHAGVVNTLNHILRLNPGSRIRAVIGGFHRLNASGNRLEQTISALQSLKPEQVVPVHCTGGPPVKRMEAALGHQTISGHSGMTLRF